MGATGGVCIITRRGRPWNSVNQVIFYGKSSELTGLDKGSQEVSTLSLHLLQQILAEPD